MANLGNNGGHGIGGMNNPFSMPNMPNTMNASSDRHGSAEQDGAEPTYLDSMNGIEYLRERHLPQVSGPRLAPDLRTKHVRRTMTITTVEQNARNLVEKNPHLWA